MLDENNYNSDAREFLNLKWSKYPNSIMPLWLADMDLKCPPFIINALTEYISKGQLSYYNWNETANLIPLVEFLQDNHNICVDPEWIVLVPSCVEAVDISCEVSRRIKSNWAHCFKPMYPPILKSPIKAGLTRNIQEMHLNKSKMQYEIDYDKLWSSTKDKPGILLWCNPHNPSGKAFSLIEIGKIERIVIERDLLIVSDEVLCDLVWRGNKRHVSILHKSNDIKQRAIVLMSGTKTFNIGGLGGGFVIIPNIQIRTLFKSLLLESPTTLNYLSVLAMIVGYSGYNSWIEPLQTELKMKWKRLNNTLSKKGILNTNVDAGSLTWIDLTRVSEKYPCKILLKKGLALSEGTEYGIPGFGRLNFACSNEVLKTSLEILIKAVKS